MNADYKQGYADGVSDIRNKLIVQIHDLLQQEKSYRDGTNDEDNLKAMTEIDFANNQGWIECLEMFQHTLTGENK